MALPELGGGGGGVESMSHFQDVLQNLASVPVR